MFPSLNGKEETVDVKDISMGLTQDITAAMIKVVLKTKEVAEKAMMDHCIDKQKIREAIISAFEKGSLISRAEIREILTKELGL